MGFGDEAIAGGEICTHMETKSVGKKNNRYPGRVKTRGYTVDSGKQILQTINLLP